MADIKKKVVKLCLDFGCIIVLAVPILALSISGKPFRRGFYCDDTSIRYPYKDSTISSLLLYFYGSGIPIITIVTVEFIRFSRVSGGSARVFRGNPSGTRDSSNLIEFAWIAYNELIVFVFGALCSQFLTDIAKYSIGRLRPHFIEVCRPVGLDTNLCPANTNTYRYIETYECANGYESTYRIKDARLSFMSGHSSFSAYAMVFTAIYIQYKVKWQTLSLLRPLIQMSLIYLAIYTGFTRISDYKHHWSDVLIGLIQGTTVAIVTAHYVGRFFRRYPEKVGVGESLRVSTTFVRPHYSSVSHPQSRSPSSPLPPPPPPSLTSIPSSPVCNHNHYVNRPNSRCSHASHPPPASLLMANVNNTVTNTANSNSSSIPFPPSSSTSSSFVASS